MSTIKKFNEYFSLNENEVFKSTIYRVPTVDELKPFIETNLDAKSIYDEICYTIIGRGMESHENKAKILMTAKKLVESFPDDQRFSEVLKMAEEFFNKDRTNINYEQN